MKTCNEFNKFTDIIEKIQYFHCQAGGRALYVFEFSIFIDKARWQGGTALYVSEFSIFIDKARRHGTVCLWIQYFHWQGTAVRHCMSLNSVFSLTKHEGTGHGTVCLCIQYFHWQGTAARQCMSLNSVFSLTGTVCLWIQYSYCPKLSGC